MNIDMISVGQRIKDRRKELNLTQTDVYHQTGIASGALSQIENGSRSPSIMIFYKLAVALDCSTDWLLTGESSNSKTSIFSESEESIIKMYRELSDDDKDELFEILSLKLRKARRGKSRSEKSSASMTTEKADMVG